MPPKDYIPVEDWYDADWKVVDSEANYYEDMDYRHNPVNTFEGDTTFEATIGGTRYKVNIMWTYFPDVPGRDLKDRITLHYFKVEDGDVPVYDDEADETVSLQDLIKQELFRVIWDYDLEYDMLKDTYPSDDYDGPDDYGYDDPRADYIYNPPMLRDPTPAEERPIKGSARRIANQPLTAQELFEAGWKVVDCDYQEEGQEYWTKYGPDLHVTHYSGETTIQGTLRGHPLTLTVSWITTGFSKQMKKTFDKAVSEKARKLSPAAKKWYLEEGEPLVEEPEGYHKGLDFEIEDVQMSGTEAFKGFEVDDYGHSFDDWLSDYTYEIFETIPPSEVLCGLE